jgi:hypothetical protein
VEIRDFVDGLFAIYLDARMHIPSRETSYSIEHKLRPRRRENLLLLVLANGDRAQKATHKKNSAKFLNHLNP